MTLAEALSAASTIVGALQLYLVGDTYGARRAVVGNSGALSFLTRVCDLAGSRQRDPGP
jgi:hypothetical protein